MPRSLERYRPSPTTDFPGNLEVLFDRLVFGHMLSEINKHVTVEEGGKYIGYLFKPGDYRSGNCDVDPNAHALLITDFLPSGPRAVRTEVEFRPDGEYQERLFREIEKVDSAIEHLGTWHTHHCNGLQELSSGDVEGYLRTVNKAKYRLNFFLASLVKRVPADPSELHWVDHFLFVRGMDRYFALTSRITLADCPTRFGDYTGHAARNLSPTRSTGTQFHGNDKTEFDNWYETMAAHRVLSEGTHFFAKKLGDRVLATRNAGRIKLTGHDRHSAPSFTYPASPGEQAILLVLKDHNITVLEISCDLARRELGFVAAIAAATEP